MNDDDPGVKVLNMYLKLSYPFLDAEINFKNDTELRGQRLINNISAMIVRDVQAMEGQGHRLISEAISEQMKTIYVAPDEDGLERHPKHFLDFP